MKLGFSLAPKFGFPLLFFNRPNLFASGAFKMRAMVTPPNFTAAANSSLSTAAGADSEESQSIAKPKQQQQPWLIVGLGNPGKKYQATRHNVGFEMLDAIAEAEGISVSNVSFRALTGKGFIGNVPVILAKPQTFMNSSGWGHCFILQNSIEASACDF